MTLTANRPSSSLHLTFAVFIGCLSFLNGIDIVLGSRGCRCYVKKSDNGPNLATHHDRIGGWLAGCNNRNRNRCGVICLSWANSLFGSSAQLTSLCIAHGQPVGPNNCTGEGLRLVVYSKLDCDGGKPYKDWRKQFLQCDRTLCCCKWVTPPCNGRVKTVWDGYICTSTLQNEIPAIKQYHASKQRTLESQKSPCGGGGGKGKGDDGGDDGDGNMH